jgi:hypothetical protein
MMSDIRVDPASGRLTNWNQSRHEKATMNNCGPDGNATPGRTRCYMTLYQRLQNALCSGQFDVVALNDR